MKVNVRLGGGEQGEEGKYIELLKMLSQMKLSK